MYERAFVLVPLIEITPAPVGEQLQRVHDIMQQMDCEEEGVTLWQASTELKMMESVN